MITGFDIYLLTRLDAVNILFGIIATVSGLGLVVTLIICIFGKIEDDDRTAETGGKLARIFIPLSILSALCLTLIPSTKEAAAIYLIPKVVNNAQVQQVPENALKLLNAKMQEWLKGLEDKK